VSPGFGGIVLFASPAAFVASTRSTARAQDEVGPAPTLHSIELVEIDDGSAFEDGHAREIFVVRDLDGDGNVDLNGRIKRNNLSASKQSRVLADILRDGLELTVGAGKDAVFVSIPGEDATWETRGRGRRRRAVWRTPEDELPVVRLVVKSSGAFQLRVSEFKRR
jgi:hypothetical protein